MLVRTSRRGAVGAGYEPIAGLTVALASGTGTDSGGCTPVAGPGSGDCTSVAVSWAIRASVWSARRNIISANGELNCRPARPRRRHACRCFDEHLDAGRARAAVQTGGVEAAVGERGAAAAMQGEPDHRGQDDRAHDAQPAADGAAGDRADDRGPDRAA